MPLTSPKPPGKRAPRVNYAPLISKARELLLAKDNHCLKFAEIKAAMKRPDHITRRMLDTMVNDKLVRRTPGGYLLLNGSGGTDRSTDADIVVEQPKTTVRRPAVPARRSAKMANGSRPAVLADAQALELTIDREDRSIALSVEGMRIKIRIAT